MRRLRLFLAAAAAAALLVPASSQAATRLTASVGPGFTINILKGGKAVKRLKPGRYVIVVRDRSNIHNFHIRGRGVNKMTSVPFVGRKSFRVTLKRGVYRYLCDPHPTTMRGRFTVG